jgi:hypothetical protein
VALGRFLATGDAVGAVNLAPSTSFALTISWHSERFRFWDLTEPLVTDELPARVRAIWAAARGGHWYWRKPVLAIERATEALELFLELGD